MVTLVYVLVYHIAACLSVFGWKYRPVWHRCNASNGRSRHSRCRWACLFYSCLRLCWEEEERRLLAERLSRGPADKRKLAKIAYVIFAACYILAIYYQLGRGFSLTYILTSGFAGEQSDAVGESSLMFLSYFRYACVGAWAVAFAYGHNKAAKTITFVLLLGIVFFSGTRAAVLVPILVPVVIHYVQKGKVPSLVALGIAVGLLVLLFAVMQVTRGGVAAGAGFDIGGSSHRRSVQSVLC